MPNKLIKKFESLFENENSSHHFEVLQNENFQLEENNELLENIQFQSGPLQWPILFSRLNLFFEIGFYVEKNQTVAMFYYGESVQQKLPRINIQLPKSKLFNILKTSAAQFIKKTSIQIPEKDLTKTTLLMRVETDKYIILLTDVADPWLKLRCESLKKVLLQHDYY